MGNWTEKLEGTDVVINLCGRSVNSRYTAANRRTIRRSTKDQVPSAKRVCALTRGGFWSLELWRLEFSLGSMARAPGKPCLPLPSHRTTSPSAEPLFYR